MLLSHRLICVALVALIVSCPSRARAAVVFGQIDDFQDGTTMGWSEGAPTISEPSNASDGPRGAADLYVRNVSSGGLGAGSKQVMFNDLQWAGNYTAAGVTRISGWAANSGSTVLHLRVAFSSSFNRFSSTRAVDLPPDGQWRPFHIDIAPGDVTTVTGSTTAEQALTNVTELRLLSANFPAFTGDAVAATLGIDNVRAMRPEGDANFDGRVDAADLELVRSNLGSAATGHTWQQGDFNFDGRVNAKDLALLRRNFGLGAPSTAGVSVLPEPASLLLVAAVPMLALGRRRR